MRPLLRVADLMVAASHSGNLMQGDTADTYTITVSNVGPAPSNGVVEAWWDALPAG